MNPKDSLSSNEYSSIYEELAEQQARHEYENYKYERMMRELERAKAKEVQLRAQKARQAYSDLCAALGVNSLGGTIAVDNDYVSIPVNEIESIAARIESLKTNVLAEGAL